MQGGIRAMSKRRTGACRSTQSSPGAARLRGRSLLPEVSDRPADFFRWGSFVNVARGSGLAQFGGDRLVLVQRQPDDSQGGKLGLQTSCGFNSVHLGKIDVHEDDIGGETSREFERRVPVGRFTDDRHIGLVFEKGRQPQPQNATVIDDENPNRRKVTAEGR